MRNSRIILLVTLCLFAGIAHAQSRYGVPAPGIGSCTSGQAVTRLNQNAPPSCTAAGTLAGPINGLPAQTGNYNAHNFKLQNLACPGTAADALVEGCAIGAFSPASGTFANLTGNGTIGLTDTSANGSSNEHGVCHDSICSGTAFGMAVGNSDNTADLQAAINAAYETGTGSATKGKVVITPDSTGGTTYNFNGSAVLDFKEVPVECAAGRNGGDSAGLINVTLNDTATSGVFIEHAGTFKNCRLTGAFAVGSGLSATISSITDGTNNQATVVTAASNSVIAGATVVISGTTNYNGVYPVASVTNNTTFVIDTGQSGTATENSGTVNYYPTVGVMAHSPTTGLSVSSVDWQNLFVKGFGTDYSLSSLQMGAGSTNDWHAKTLYAQNAIVGLIANGNGFPLAGSNSNVASGEINGMTCVSVAGCFYGGPMVNTSSDISDSEETSFGNNRITGLDFETANTHSSDSGLVWGIWVGSYGNQVGPINYVSAGATAGASQTAKGEIRTKEDTGPNFIIGNRVGSSAGDLVANTAVDVVENNATGISANQSSGRAFVSGVSLAAKGQTPNAIAVVCHGSCATAGSGGVIHSYALVGIGWDGNKSTASAQFACPADATGLVTYVASGGSCPAGALGPNGGYTGSNYVTPCWTPDPNYESYDVLIDDTAHETHLAFASGSNGNNCYPDTSATKTSYTAPAKDTTGGINESNTNATNILGAQIHMAPVAVASLPSTCAAGDSIPVTNWNGTTGTCTGGGTDYTIATCGASNTWYCP